MINNMNAGTLIKWYLEKNALGDPFKHNKVE